MKALHLLMSSTIAAALALGLTGCNQNGDAVATYSIGGTVSGLASGQHIALQNGGGDTLTVSTNGSFTFASAVSANGSYSVTVSGQPTGQTCSVATNTGSGSGVVANVTSVKIACATDSYAIRGTVSGLASGQQVILQNNGADALTLNADGNLAFATPVAYNGMYSVTVATQPTSQTCTVSNGSGSGVVAAVTTVAVTCSINTFTISGTVSGLASGQQVVLQNSGADALTLNADGSLAFATPVAYNGSYSVTVSTQPTGQTCTVNNGSGAGVVANVSNVAVTCSINTFTISGTVSGLASGQQVTLRNNGADAITLNANGSLVFAMPIAYNGSYRVTVGTQPTGQTCTVGNGSGTGVAANVSNVAVTCSTSTYTVSGTVSGLPSGQQVTLQNNAADPLTLQANGSFTFATPVVYNGSYSVTVGTQPTGASCSVTSGTGSNVTANVTGVSVSCVIHSVYVSDGANGQIFQYGIQGDGTLAPVATPVATAPSAIFGMAVHPNGHYLYATVGSANAVAQYTIAADGSLTAMATPTVPSGTQPYKAVVSPNGQFLFVGNQAVGSISSYTIGNDGSLTAVGTYSCTSACQNTQGLTVDPSSSHLYIVGAQNSNIITMTVGSDGSLSTPTSIGAFVTHPGFVAVDPTGAYLVTAAASTIVKFSISPMTGLLTYGASTSASGSSAGQMVFDPSGSHLYLNMSGSAAVDQFSWLSGTLTALSPASVSAGATQTGTAGTVIDSSGQYVYTVNRTSKDISQFVVGSGGTLTLNPVSGVASIPSTPTPDPYAIAIR